MPNFSTQIKRQAELNRKIYPVDYRPLFWYSTDYLETLEGETGMFRKIVCSAFTPFVIFPNHYGSKESKNITQIKPKSR